MRREAPMGVGRQAQRVAQRLRQRLEQARVLARGSVVPDHTDRTVGNPFDGAPVGAELIPPEQHLQPLCHQRLDQPPQVGAVQLVASDPRGDVRGHAVPELERLVAADHHPPAAGGFEQLGGQAQRELGVVRCRSQARRLREVVPQVAGQAVGALGATAVGVVAEPAAHVAECVQVGHQLHPGRGRVPAQFVHLAGGQGRSVAPHGLVAGEREGVLHIQLKLAVPQGGEHIDEPAERLHGGHPVTGHVQHVAAALERGIASQSQPVGKRRPANSVGAHRSGTEPTSA